MVLSKLSPDPEKAEELAYELKKILDAIMLRNPDLNSRELEKARQIRTELEEMGFHVTLNYRLELDPENPLNSKVDTEVNLWIPKNTTIQ